MDAPTRYEQLWQSATAQLRQGKCHVYPLLDSPTDLRRGITLLARPPAPVLMAIQNLLQPLRALEPAQYYYPSSDVHLTVLSIISCQPGFTLDQINPVAYAQVVQEALRQVPAFEIDFRGVTASPACVMVQGFVAGPGLALLRENLRKAFQSSGLAHTIDSRYPIQTAHSTVVRYRKQLERPHQFLEKLQDLKNAELGTWRVQALELVYNDWYQKRALTQTLATFKMPAV